MLALAFALCGCFKTKDELTLNADGSGAVRLETRLLIPSETLQGLGMGMGLGGNEGPVTYPPTSEAEAKRWFPTKDFKMTAKEDRADDVGSTLVITAEFKEVNALLASPYSKAHGLTLVVTNGALSLKAVTGIEAAARLAELKDNSGMFGGMMASMEELAKKKDEKRTEFRVTLPNAVSSANTGGAREGKTVTWTMDRARQTNAAEFAQQAGAVLEASCSAEGVKFSAATAKFVPLALQVVRSINLSGEGGSPQNQAQLVGAVVLPREFAPQKWGEAKLDEVVDEKGNNLKFEETDEAARMARRFGSWGYASSDGADDEEGGDNTPSVEKRHTVALTFQPPDWKVREIARVKGSIPLHYFGGAQVLKFSNAIPEKWIRVMTHEADVDFDPTGKSINDPTLPETGLSLRLTMGVAQGPITTLLIQAGGNKLSVTDGQVYDAAGRPWPTFFQKQGFGGEGSFTLMVAGRPAAPLSLALVVNSVGASVDLPFLVEKVPLRAR